MLDALRGDKGIGCVVFRLGAEGEVIYLGAEVTEQEGLVKSFTGDVLDGALHAVDGAGCEGGGEVDAFIDAGVKGEDGGGEGFR